jgi:hypothetical protein
MRVAQTLSLLPFVLFAYTLPSYAAQCSAKSGEHVVPLLELYTSEGCSSCPPADKWLSTLDTTNLTPLAFHVDYWNYIGWKDRFSKEDFSIRQRKLGANAAGFVYTPQFVLNGKDFRGWNNTRLTQATERIQQLSSPAQLQLDAAQSGSDEMTLKATATVPESTLAKRADVFVALYENNLVSKVNAGENNGSELHHDYVVRELFGAYSMQATEVFNKQFNLNSAWKKRDAGAVIFVQDRQTGAILQSLSLPFCP